MWTLAITFGLALTSSWTLTFLAAHLGRQFRVLDYPDKERKFHARATPRTGGLAVCGTLLIVAAAAFWFTGKSAAVDGTTPPFAPLLLLSTALLCGLGLWDDKWGMEARTKFAWQVVAIIPFVCWGRATTAVDLLGWHLEGAVLTVPLILFWLVACTNFVNLIDGLDGLASAVGLIVVLAVAVLAWLGQFSEVSLMAAIVAGSLSGFLLHNWPPAWVFLGDCGSLPLGFLVGALSLEVAAKKAAGMTLAVPIVLLCIPMFDTSMAILRRKLNGRKIGQGDRAHIHHCLRDRGLSPTQTLLVMGGLCGVTACAAIVSTALDQPLVAIATCGGLLAFLIAGKVFGFDETMLLVRHFQAVGGVLGRAPRAMRARFITARLAASVASGQLELWHKLVHRARRLPGVELSFVCEHAPSGRELVSLGWSADEPINEDSPVWCVSYTVPRGNGVWARGEARGVLHPQDDSLAFHELAEMLAVLCRTWPVGADVPTDSDLASDRPRSDAPRILSPHWPAAFRHKHDDIRLRGLDRDAA